MPADPIRDASVPMSRQALDTLASGTRCCSRCRELKPLTEFFRERRTALGRRHECKVCHTAAQKPRSTPDVRKGVRTRASEARYAERTVARGVLKRALAAGDIQRWPVCAMPECEAAPEAHHPDYSQPLAVVWLCKAHHRQVHVEAREEESRAEIAAAREAAQGANA